MCRAARRMVNPMVEAASSRMMSTTPSAWHAGDVQVRRIVPDLPAEHPGASADFYREVLGLERAMDQGWIATFVAPGNPAAQISLMSEDATAPVRPDVSIEVDDVDAAHAAAERLGCEIVHPLSDEPWGVRRFFVREPNGNILNILSHPPAPDP